MWPDRDQNLLVLRSLQLSCRREVRVSLYRSYLHERHVPDVKEKGRRPYLSQNIGSAVAGSAGSVPPPLPKKCTSDFHNAYIVIQQIRMYLRYDVRKHNYACVQARPNYGKWGGSESPDENYTVQV